MIISFGWTRDAFIAGRKSVTRRNWTDNYARGVTPGCLMDAYDCSPRAGGRKIAVIRVLSCQREALSRLITEPAYAREELQKEGGMWRDVKEFLELFRNFHSSPYRIEFEIVYEK